MELQPLPDTWTIRALLVTFGGPSTADAELTDFIVCFCSRFSQAGLDELRMLVPGLQQDDFAGNNYITVRWTEYDLIEDLCNRILQTRHLQIACRTQPYYARGERFEWATFEQKVGAQFEDNWSRLMPVETAKCPWTWATQAGRDLSNRLRRPYIDDDDVTQRSNFWTWRTFQIDPCKFYAPGRGREQFLRDVADDNVAASAAIVPATYVADIEVPAVATPSAASVIDLTDADGSPRAKKQCDEEPGECMICMDAAPDTLVLPCMHQVVCRQCSGQLRATRDAATCLRCRKPITDVLMDGYQ